jgi:hypothetical protein
MFLAGRFFLSFGQILTIDDDDDDDDYYYDDLEKHLILAFN